MKAGIIYRYKSPSGKYYIGQTVNSYNRKAQHKSCAKLGSQTYFYRAIRKYGFDNFEYKELITIKSNSSTNLKIILDSLERYYIRRYKSNDKNFGYNLTAGGGGITDTTKEVREKISKALRGRQLPKGVKDQISDTLKRKYASGEITSHNARTIYAYKNNKIIGVYCSLSEAARQLGILTTSISNILSGRAKQTRTGLTFKYKDFESGDIN